jgi:hypothetical protein
VNGYLSWQLATNDGKHVDLVINGFFPDVFQPPTQIFITMENASQYGVDFAAWEMAVNDPAYTRSFVTFNGMTQESEPYRTGGFIDLDRFLVSIDHPLPGTMGFIYPVIFASEAVVVPEPLALAVLTIAALHLSTMRCSLYRHLARGQKLCR